MNKRGQLGIIEFKYFMVGLFIGILLGLILVYLGNINVIPFQIQKPPLTILLKG